jgi:hypothetical protein
MKSDPMAHLEDLEALSGFLRCQSLATQSFNDALVCASLYGRLHWDNISGLFSDDSFEQALFEKWRQEFCIGDKIEREQIVEGGLCHILTRYYPSGGHSRLFRQISKGIADRGLTQSLIVTQKTLPRSIKHFPDYLASTLVLSGNMAQRARDIYAKARNADTVLLYTHPDDIGGALAARALRSEGIKVLFVNHADHVFSFGPGACDSVLEICATGWKTTQERRSPKAQSFMGIPMTSASEYVPVSKTNRSGPILSIGGPGKFRPSSELSFPQFLADLLEAVPNDVVLIGPTIKQEWWKLVLERFPGRIQLMGIQPPEVLEKEYCRASCYVDSFPMDGGTVFSEAVLSGLPAFSLNSQAALGISPADALRCAGPKELVAAVSSYLNGGTYPFEIEAVQSLIATDFNNEATVERIINAANGDKVPLPDYLLRLGNRSPDYNVLNWRANSELHIPKRAWRKLSFITKLRLFYNSRLLKLSSKTARTLKRRIILG